MYRSAVVREAAENYDETPVHCAQTTQDHTRPTHNPSRPLASRPTAWSGPAASERSATARSHGSANRARRAAAT
jgi:hypothetical protein